MCQAIAVLARAHQDAIWRRTKAHNELRSLLREFFPTFLATFVSRFPLGIASPEARAVLAIAPTPAAAAKVSVTRIAAALRRAGRSRNVDQAAAAMKSDLRTPQLRQPVLVEKAMGVQVLALLAALGRAATGSFQQHPDYAIITSFPGLADSTGARVLAEIGNDRARFADARALKAYAGSAPVTRASGRSISITHRRIKNDRLAAVGWIWAFGAASHCEPAREQRQGWLLVAAAVGRTKRLFSRSTAGFGVVFERARTPNVTAMTTPTASQTWIITGASKGLGRALAGAALAAGDQVVAAVRNPDSVADLNTTYGDRVTSAAFDARDTSEAASLVQVAVDRYGRLDVLVNNAGRAIVGAAEEVTDKQLRDLMDLHLFGPAALVRAALPVMRAQGGGTIVQMSSQGGRMSFPGVSTYSASKFALEGWSEALAGEVAPFGIRVMLVEPSRFRTAFNAAEVLDFTAISPTYREILTDVRADMSSADGNQEGDPVKAAQIIVSLAHSEELPLRLPLGAEAVERLAATYQRGLDGVSQWAELARSADFTDVATSVRPI